MEEKVYSVFISYSWTSPEHEQWVHDLALRLMETDGIDVKLDKWDLKPGQDKFAFMESMVNDENIDKVLLICEKGYKEKADKRTGGVGTEAQIITTEIYNKTHQEKFIPVIVEHGEAFDSYMPTYIKSRIGIDMSTAEVYEAGYEKLLRTIAERPMYRKPTRGKLPSYLFEEEKSHFRTKNLNKQLKNFLISKPENVGYVISDFIEEFKNTLNEFKLDSTDLKEPFDEHIYNAIKDMQPLRDDYIEFMSLICKAKYTFDIDIIVNLFEEMYSHTSMQDMGSSYEIQFDHFKFFLHELFLYTTIVLLEYGLYNNLQMLLTTRFLVKNRNELSYIGFDKYRFYIRSLDEYRKNRLNSQYISLATELLIQRSTINNKNYKDQLTDADLLLYYISTINNNATDQNAYRPNCWFPATYIYSEYRKIELLIRLSSTRYFEKVKILFNVSTKEEMQSIIINFQNPYSGGYNQAFYNIPHIQNYIKPEEICSFL